MDYKLCVPCLLGLEGPIADELRRMKMRDVAAENGRVFFTGNEEDIARANINLRIGERVLIEVGSFDAFTFDQLFEGTKALPWEMLIPKNGAFPVKGYSLNSKLFSVSDCQKIIKKAVVEKDATEKSLRRVLNFGHTLAHAIESAEDMAHYYHGECVALGMLPMCAPALRPRVEALLEKLGLPTSTDLDKEQIWQAMQHDKKSNSAGFSAVFVEGIGKAYAKNITFAEMKTILEGAWQA